MTALSSQPCPPIAAPGRSSRSAAFTLSELLVVMALIVLALAVAIPAFNVITNGRRIESAENQISAFLAVTRSEAIGLQQPRGVIFFVDPGSDRVTLAQIYYPNSTNSNLELFPNRDEMTLPAGVGLLAVPNGVPPASMSNWPKFAIIMFDGDGNLELDTCSVVAGSLVGTRVVTPAGGSPSRMTVPQTNILSHIGFELFDKSIFEQQATGAPADSWLADNAVPYLVNRYNGTLLKGQ